MNSQDESERARRVEDGLSASSPRSGADDGNGAAQWDEWYRRDSDSRTIADQLAESPHDYARRAFLAGWSARGTGPQAGELLGYAVVLTQHNAAENHSWLAGCDVLSEGVAARAAVEAEDHTPFEAVVCELRAADRDAALRRAAADELAALTDELGLYGDGEAR
jgi:hypothetical protein